MSSGENAADPTVSTRYQKKSKLQNFTEFLYHKDSGKFLGRTAGSWARIIIFYIFFYAFLAGFWSTCLYVFLQTLSSEEPRWYGKGSIIGNNPGMGYQPWLKKNAESTLIKFNRSDSSTYEKYTDQLKAFLSVYDSDDNTTRVCVDRESNRDVGQLACRFHLDEFSREDCGEDNDFGYADGKPCVVVYLNRLMGWLPMKYPKDSVPDEVKSRYNEKANFGGVAIDCEGEYFADRDNIGDIKYIPAGGLEGRYFPFKKFPKYHQPIAMLKFLNPPNGTLIEVECHAYAYNIVTNQADRLGMVHFELLVDA